MTDADELEHDDGGDDRMGDQGPIPLAPNLDPEVTVHDLEPDDDDDDDLGRPGDRGRTVSWYVARSLDQLLAEINASAPHRSKASDGSIGDASHSASHDRSQPV